VLLQSAKKDRELVEKKLNSCLEQLLSDTINHFQLEEKYMEEYQFPARKKHQQEHNRVLVRMTDQCDYWQSQHNLKATLQLEQYISEEFPQWLVNHIVTMDTVIASYIARHGGKSL
jgi:hemerythrin